MSLLYEFWIISDHRQLIDMPSSQTWLNLSYTPPSNPPPPLYAQLHHYQSVWKRSHRKTNVIMEINLLSLKMSVYQSVSKLSHRKTNAILDINPLRWKWWLTYWQSPLQLAMNESGPWHPLHSRILLFDPETMVISSVVIPQLDWWHRYLAEIFSTSQWCMCTIYICWVLLWFNTGY